MENASKALLIAAAVLIVILVIAFGMNIFNQAKDSGDAGATAGTIKDGIGSATDKLQGAISGGEKAMTAEEFNAQFKINQKMTGTEAKAYGIAIGNGEQYSTNTLGGKKTVGVTASKPLKDGEYVNFSFDWPDKEYIFVLTDAHKDSEGYATKLVCCYNGSIP